MHGTRRQGWFVAAMVATGLMLAACSELGPLEPTTTPEPTFTPTITPTPAPTATPTPQRIDNAPALPDGASTVVSGVLHIEVAPGTAERVNPIDLTEAGGGQPPACAAFVSAWEWTASPASAAETLRFETLLQGTTIHMATGAAGMFDSGCSELAIVNRSEETVSVDLRYAIGSL